MKQIYITLFVLMVLVATVNAGELYNCIDRNGNTIITSSPQDDMTNCVIKDSYDDPTPEERAKQQKQKSINNPTNTSTPVFEDKCKSVRDKSNKATAAYYKENNQRIKDGRKQPTYDEKKLREEMFAAQKEEHACVFSPENIKKGNVYQETITTTIKRGK